MLLAACETICEFNVGKSSKAEVIKELTGEVGDETLSGFFNHDEERLKNSLRKVSGKSRFQRRKRRAEKKSKRDPSKTTYLTGVFGTGIEPEV